MKTRIAAIEFGTSKIVTVIAQSGSRNNHCDIISCGKVDYAGYSSGDWNDWENLSKAVYNSIIAAQSDAGQPIKDIYIGVPCEFIHVVTAEAETPIKSEDGRVSLADIQAVEDIAAEVYSFKDSEDMVIHRSPAWYKVDGGVKSMDPTGRKGDFLSACISFITVSADFVDDMRELMGHVGITINGFLSPSLGEQLLLTKPTDRDQSCIFIDSGMYNTEFSVLRGDCMVYHAVLPCGGNDITEYLADELDVRYDEAELLKRSAVISDDVKDMIKPPVSRDKDGRRIQYKAELVCSMVSVALEKICRLIKLTEEEARVHLMPRSRVYLTGGGIALMRGGADYLEKYLDRKVEVASASSNKLGSPEYTSVLGLVDLIFDSIEQRFDEQETLPMRVADTFKGLFGRNIN
ncbi:MAG: hypothetical protein IKR85_04585 [Clostridia bacterium]|nr:hypothetical protein [Clostridia bacterium]